MESSLILKGKKYIPARQGAKMVGYAGDYVGQLCRTHKVPAERIGTCWYVCESSLVAYKAHQDQLNAEIRQKMAQIHAPVVAMPVQNPVVTTVAPLPRHPRRPILAYFTRSLTKLAPKLATITTKTLVSILILMNAFGGPALALSLFTPATAFAAINTQINYQGKLTDTSGTAVTNGSYNMEFSLYTAASGGTALWTETLSGGNRVSVSSGLFSVMLGAVTSLASVDFNQTLYLGVKIGGSALAASWDSEMTPRKILGAVPAAFESRRLEGLSSSQFLRTDAVNATSTASTFVTITQSGAGNALTVNGLTSLSNLLLSGSTTLQNFTALNATTTSLAVTGTATSTFTSGINLTTGCFAVNGTCLSATGGGGSGTITSGTTNALAYYTGATTVDDTTGIFVDNTNTRLGIGTSSPYASLSVVGQVVATYYTATSSTASVFPYASTTAISASGTGFFGNLLATGSSTLQDFTAQNSTSTNATTTSLFATVLRATTLALTNALGVTSGGTGLTTPPSFGEVLVGNTTGGYTLTATSSLGLLTTNVAEGTNQYFTTNRVAGVIAGTTTTALAEGTNLYYTTERFDNRLSATTSLPNITTLSGLTSAPALSLSATQLTNFGTPFFTFFSATTTDALTEGATNRYFTTDRVAGVLAGTTTDALAEGSVNRYYSTNLFAGSLAGTTTTALAEGSNLYFTTARVASVLAGTTTDALAQGSTNKYYSTNLFAGSLAGTTTTALAEGTNLYYTTTRFDNRLSATTSLPNITTLAGLTSAPALSLSATQLTNFGTPFFTFFSATTTDALTEGATNRYFTTDRVAGVLAGTTTDALAEGSVNRYYSTNLFAGSLAGTTTTALAEGSNLYFTTARVAGVIAGTTTTALAEGTNLYYTTERFDNRLSATTSLPNITTLTGLTTIGSLGNLLITGSSTLQNFTFVNATGTSATTTNFFATTASSTNLYSSNLAIGGNVLTTSGGNVGVGTASPSVSLQIGADQSWAGSVGNYKFAINSTGVNAISLNAPTGSYHQTDWLINNNRVLYEQVTSTGYDFNGQLKLVMATGNFGIGTTSPGQKLSVAGDILGNNIIGSYFTGTSTTASTLAGALTSSGVLTGSALVASSASATSTLAGGLAIETSGFVYDYSTNNVGIGTASPGQNLHVAGTDGDTRIRISDTSAGGYGVLEFYNDTGIGAFFAQNGSTNAAYGGANSFGIINVKDAPLALGANNSIHMTILGDGRVGIGTAGPVNKLDVEGAMVIGATYSGTNAAPTNGLLVEGNVGIGTTSPGQKLSVAGDILGNNIIGSYFTATTSTASVFPYASTTALTISGTNGLQLATGLNGPLQANGGLVSATTSVGVVYGGTGLTSAPAYGQILLGNASSGYTLSATSSLGLLGSSTISSLTSNYVPKWGGSTFSNSNIYDDGTNVGIGTTSPGQKLSVAGDILGNNIIGSYFTATTTNATSTFSGLSATNISSNSYITTNGTFQFTSPYAATLNVTTQQSAQNAILSATASNGKIFSFISNDSLATISTQPGVPLVLNTAGSERIRIDTAGLVGIGTSTPGQMLSVAGDILGNNIIGSYFTATSSSATSNIAGLLTVAGLTTLGNASTTQISSTGSAYFATSGGNVGIGTTSPMSALSVNSGQIVVADGSLSAPAYSFKDRSNSGFYMSADGIIVAHNGTNVFNFRQGGNYVSTNIYPASDNSYALGSFGNKWSGVYANRAYTSLGSASAPSYGFDTGDGNGSNGGIFFAGTYNSNAVGFTTSGAERMRIDSSGNIGIGTTSPGQKLSVAGDILGNNIIGSYFTGTSTTASTFAGVITSTATAANTFPYASTTALSVSGASYFTGLSTLANLLATGSSTLQNFTFVNATGTSATTTNFFATTASSTDLYSSNLAVGGTVLTTSGGNVGIGTASPSTKLEVNGTFRAGNASDTYMTYASSADNLTFRKGSYNISFGYDDSNSFAPTINTSDATGVLTIKATSTILKTGATANLVNTLKLENTGGTIGSTATAINFRAGGNVGKGIIGYTNQSVWGVGDLFLGVNGVADNTTASASDAKLTIQGSSGNIGIGTTSPGQKLSVAGDILGNNIIGSYFTATTSTASTFAYASTTALSISSLTSGRVPYATTGGLLTDNSALTYDGTKFTATYASTTAITASGLATVGTLGVGSTSPSTTLGVVGSGYFTGGIGVGKVNTSAGTLVTSGNITTSGDLYMGGGTYNAITMSGNQMQLGTSNVGSVYTPANLSVAGTITGTSATGYTSLRGAQSDSSAYNSGVLTLNGGVNTDRAIQFGIASSNGNNWIQSWSNGSVAGNLNLQTSGGNVGIGTTSPGQKLSVAGDILGSNIIGSYFTATTSSATSTFAGGLAVASSTFNILNHNGYVGIGTTSPTSKLVITGNVGGNGAVQSVIENTNTNGRAVFVAQNDGGNTAGFETIGTASVGLNLANAAVFYGGGTSKFVLMPDGAVASGGTAPIVFRLGGYALTEDRIIFTSTGSIGVGTTSPGQKLSVAGDILGNNLIGSYFTATSTTASAFQNLTFGNATGTNATTTNFFATTASSTNLYSSNLAVGGTTLVTSGGNVGVGTASPSYKLDVSGDIRATGSLGVGTTPSGTQGRIDLAGSGGASVISAASSDSLTIQANGGGKSLTLSADNINLQASGGGATAVSLGGTQVLDTSRNLFNINSIGIGTTSPSTTLSVAGSAYVTTGLGVGKVNTVANTVDVALGTNTIPGAYRINGVNMAMASTTLFNYYFGAAGATANLNTTSVGQYNLGFGFAATGGSGAMTTATQNVGLGVSTLYSLTTGGYNTALGSQSSVSLTTGTNNVAVGITSAYTMVSGANNVAVGSSALYTATSTSFNTAVGAGAMAGAVGYASGEQNTAVGAYSLYRVAAGSNNVGIGGGASAGVSALAAVSSGSYNVGIGYQPLTSLTTNSNNIGIGHRVGQQTTGSTNTFLGYFAGYANTSGSDNIAIGNQADFASGILDKAVAIGYLATVGCSECIVLGRTAVAGVGIGTTTPYAKLSVTQTGTSGAPAFIVEDSSSDSTPFVIDQAGLVGIGSTSPATTLSVAGSAYVTTGLGVGKVNTTANTIDLATSGASYGAYRINGVNIAIASTTNNNYFFGGSAGNSTTINTTMTGILNTGVGVAALNSLTTGTQNTAVGYSQVTLSTGDYNASLGASSLRDLSTGSNNTAVGANALVIATSSSYNTAVGYLAMGNAQYSGSRNIAIGPGTLYSNTLGNDNLAIGGTLNGAAALTNNTTGSGNVAVGGSASGLGAAYGALRSNTTGSLNTALGVTALAYSSTGSNNTVLGAGAGPTIGTGSNNTLLGYGADVVLANDSYYMNLGGVIFATSTNFTNTTNNFVGIGTTTPSARLSVKGTGTGVGRLFALADSGNAEKFTVLDNGKVGIGTTSPTSTLTVNGAVRFNSNADPGDYFYTNAISSDGRYEFRSADNSGVANQRVFMVSGYSAGCVGFGNSADSALNNSLSCGGSTGNSIVATPGGLSMVSVNIGGIPGVGTNKTLNIATPYSTSGVATSSNSMVDISTASTIANAGTGQRPGIHFAALSYAFGVGDGIAYGTGDGYSTRAMTIASSTEVGIGSTTPYGKLTVTQTGTGGAPAFIVEDSASDSTPFVITQTGLVGIGTTSPATTLSVAGSAYITTGLGVGLLNTTSGTIKANTAYDISAGGTYKYNGVVLAQASTTLYSYFYGLAGNLTHTSANNNGFGAFTLDSLTTGGNNDAFGYNVLTSNTTGSNNVGMGVQALLRNVTGNYNVGIGTSASNYNTAATSTVAIGSSAARGSADFSAQGYSSVGAESLFSITTGADYNTAIGYRAGYLTTTGSSNIFLGSQAGLSNVTGSSNIYIGNSGTASDSNQIAIGTVFYATSTNSNFLSGIGTSTPSARFSIKASGASTGRVFVISDSSNAEKITVLDNGHVGIGTTSPYAALSVVGSTGVVAQMYTATSTTATSTFAGGLNVGSGALTYDFSSGITSISNLEIGAFSFDTNAGAVSWADMPVTGTATANTVESYSAQIDGTAILTVYSESDGAGSIQYPRVGINTTAPGYGLTVVGTASFNGLSATAGAGEVAVCLDPTTKELKIDAGQDCTGSSQRYKNNINNLTTSDGLSLVKSLRPVSFDFNIDGSSHVGFIAEEVAALDPRLAVFETGSTTPHSVRYAEMTAVLAKAIQELATTTAFISNEWASTSPAFVVDASGNIGIGTTTPAYKLHVVGDIAATSFVNISTREAKKDITYLSADNTVDMLTKIKALNVATYRYNIEPNSNPLRLGLIAEEVPSEILAAGGKGVDVYKLSTFILAGVKAQQTMLESLETRIARLEANQTNGGGSSVSISDYLQTMGVQLSATVAQFKNAVIETLTVGTSEKPSGITLYDEVTKQPYCLKIVNGATATTPGVCTSVDTTPTTATSSPSVSTSSDTIAPVITILGNNPATIDKGTTYLDPGATVTDNINDNLGVTTTNGEIDTTVPGTYTVTYTATDTSGNTATATRTVTVTDTAGPNTMLNVAPPEETVVVEPAPEVVPNTVTTTPETSTDTTTATSSPATN